MKPAKYHPLARSEMIASALFYEERNRGLGERFLKAVEATEAGICEHPLGDSHSRPGLESSE